MAVDIAVQKAAHPKNIISSAVPWSKYAAEEIPTIMTNTVDQIIKESLASIGTL